MAPQAPLQLAFGQLVAAGAMLAPLAAFSAGDVMVSEEAIVAVVGLGVLSTAIAWPILFRLNMVVGPMATSTVTFLNPVFGTLWGALFLAEAISPTFLAGGLLVVISLLLIFDVGPPARIRAKLGRRVPDPVPAGVDE
jgi:drug/metabolite transporter (DMT)-like permease